MWRERLTVDELELSDIPGVERYCHYLAQVGIRLSSETHVGPLFLLQGPDVVAASPFTPLLRLAHIHTVCSGTIGCTC